MVKGIEHVGIYCRDSKKLADWYCEMFDMHCVSDNGSGIYFIKSDNGFMFEIVPMSEDLGKLDEKAQGIRHIALSVDKEDYEALRDKLIASGAESLREVPPSEDMKNFFFRDIEGNVMHIIYRSKPL